MRNLDLTALRSFVTVAEVGGVTRAAGHLNLTQSAVSMQLKRLEDSLGKSLLDRSARTISLTPMGDQLLSYARRMLVLNDEAVARLTDDAYEGEVVLGVPHDILYPAIPPVLAAIAKRFPRLKVRLVTEHTRRLKQLFAAGQCDLIVTTESRAVEDAEPLVTLPLSWIGAEDGSAYRSRPLKLAFCRNCIFAPMARAHLDAADIQWETVIDSDSDRALETAVMADLGVCALVDPSIPPGTKRLGPDAGLPVLPDQTINMYRSTSLPAGASEILAQVLRDSFVKLGAPRSAAE